MKKNRTFIIAEAGVNHNGSLDLAKELIDIAASAHADAIKFQTFIAENIVLKNAPIAGYQKKSGTNESQYALLKTLQLDEEAHHILAAYCRERNIEFLSTAFDRESLDMLVNKLKIRRIKIPSGEITNGPLLLQAARTGKPIILSTGMSTLNEIKEALGVLAFRYTDRISRPSRRNFRNAFMSEMGQKAIRRNVTLLHCTTEYPAPPDEINLRAIVTLRSKFGTRVGFSDHSAGIYAAFSAVAIGASVIEKHFTLDKNLPGPDHQASLEADELSEMVRAIRLVERYLGDSKKIPTISELKNRDIVRKSIIADRPIEKDSLFSDADLACKRPASGLSPMMYWDILGKAATRNYKKNDFIVLNEEKT